VFADWCEENGESKLAARLRAGENVASKTDEIGRMLWRINVASVAYRYSSHTDLETEWAASYADVEAYTYTPAPVLIRVALLKTIGCYQYQSCEHPEWDTSEAFKLTESIKPDLSHLGKVAYDTPLGQATPWGWEDDKPLKEIARLGGIAPAKSKKPRRRAKLIEISGSHGPEIVAEGSQEHMDALSMTATPAEADRLDPAEFLAARRRVAKITR
jgi:hypothetical protein